MPEHLSKNVLSWASDLDGQTRAQAERTASLPFVEKPLALMADAHLGMGATVGSVIPTKDAIIPAAVGVDIGCGMMAVRIGPGHTQFTVMPSRPSSTASDRVSPITPCLAAVYGLSPDVAPSPSVDAMLTMRGHSERRMCVSDARIV